MRRTFFFSIGLYFRCKFFHKKNKFVERGHFEPFIKEKKFNRKGIKIEKENSLRKLNLCPTITIGGPITVKTRMV